MKFAQHGMVVCSASVLVTEFDVDDIQRVLSQDGYLRKFAKRIQSHVPTKRDGAIIASVALGNTQGAACHGVVFVGRKLDVTALVRSAVTEATKTAKTIHVLAARLDQLSTALSTASALAHLLRTGKSPSWTIKEWVYLSPRSDDVTVMASKFCVI